MLRVLPTVTARSAEAMALISPCVPAQQCSGGDEPQPAQTRGQQSAQRAEDGAVDPGRRRAGVVSAQNGNLVTEHQDLDVFGCVGLEE
jgi:hypothetical protein